MNKIPNPVNLSTKENLKIILKGICFFAIIAIIYNIVLHETIHYTIIRLLGYSGQIDWSLLLPNVVPSESIYGRPWNLFFAAMAPYLFGIIVLIIFLILYNKSKNPIITKLAAFPIMDLAANLIAGVFFLILRILFYLRIRSDFSDVVIVSIVTKNIFMLIFMFIIITSLILLAYPFLNSIIQNIKSYYTLLKIQRDKIVRL